MAAYISGVIVGDEEAKISIFDRGFLFGDGTFWTLRTYGGKIFRLEKGIDWLFEQAKELKIPVIWEKEKVRGIIVQTYNESLKRREITKEAWIRVLLTRGINQMGVATPWNINDCKPSLYVIVSRLDPPPAKFFDEGVKLKSIKIERILPHTKNMSFLASIYSTIVAQENGYFDSVLVNHKGQVTESSTANIFGVKDNVLYTPSEGILSGIIREEVIDLARENSIELREEMFDLDFLKQADEVFLTSISKDILPVSHVNEMKIRQVNGPVTKLLRNKYQELINEFIKTQDG